MIDKYSRCYFLSADWIMLNKKLFYKRNKFEIYITHLFKYFFRCSTIRFYIYYLHNSSLFPFNESQLRRSVVSTIDPNSQSAKGVLDM